MTNIRTVGIFPEVLPNCHEYVNGVGLFELFEARGDTYRGFAEIEADKGLLTPTMSLSTPSGQEAVRILMQRGLEELVEAYESLDRDHFLEELIDSINYFWSIAVLDPETPIHHIIDSMVWAYNNDIHSNETQTRIKLEDFGKLLCAASPLMESLRHRAWMNNPQSPTFDGWAHLSDFLCEVFTYILKFFEDYQEFASFFIAKDNVLKFRLETKY